MRLGRALKIIRVNDGVGTREQAKEIGITSATLNRIENGEDCSLPALVKVIVWLTQKDERAA